MSAKFFPAVPDYIRGWYRLRAKRKAMLMATEEISNSPDAMLNDMGILRDDVTSAFNHRNRNLRTEADSAPVSAKASYLPNN